MGNGIAHVFAQNDFNVNLVDISEEALKSAMSGIEKNLDRMLSKEKITEEKKLSTLNHISTFTDVKKGVGNADLVVEAATENVALKKYSYLYQYHLDYIYWPSYLMIDGDTTFNNCLDFLKVDISLPVIKREPIIKSRLLSFNSVYIFSSKHSSC